MSYVLSAAEAEFVDTKVARPHERDAVVPFAPAGATGHPLVVETCKKLSSGHMRNVYEFPTSDRLLLKVIRPERVGAKNNFIGSKKKLKFKRTFGLYISFYRELKEMLRIARRIYPLTAVALPIARVYGLLETTQGLGLVVEKISMADGSPAPNLTQLVMSDSFSPRHRQCLDAFYQACIDNHIVIGDCHTSNLVFTDRDGGRFICIDGTGDKSIVPVHQWSAFANRLKLRRAQRRMAVRIEELKELRLRKLSKQLIAQSLRSSLGQDFRWTRCLALFPPG